MIQWLNRITMSDKVGELTYKGENPIVTFTYIRKDGKETERRMNLKDAILLAEQRREDGRYKNYEFHISE